MVREEEQVRDGFGRVLLNGMTGAGVRIGMMLIGFVLTPYIVFSLGMEDFGLLAVFGSLASYLGLLDFGIGGTFVKFVTEYTEKDDVPAARQVLTFGTLFYLAFGLVLAIPVFAFSPAIVGLFKMAPGTQPHAVIVFREFFALVVASMALGIPGTATVAKQRMDLAIRNNFVGYLVYVPVVAVLLYLRWGINALVAAQAVQIAVSATLQYVTARRLFGPLWHDPRALETRVIRRMFGFGGWTQVTGLLNVFTLDAGRFICASFISVAAVTYYEIGGKLAYISRTLPNYLVDAVSPAAAAADAHADTGRLDRIQLAGSLYLLLLTTVIAGFVVGACGPIVRVWMGVEYPYVEGITALLAVGYVASSSGTVGLAMLRSTGRPDLEALCVGVGAAVNVVATIVLAPAFGIVGVAAGAAAGWIGFMTFFALLDRRRRPRAWNPSGFGSALRIVAVGSVCTLLLYGLVHRPWVWRVFDSKVAGLAALAFCGLLYVTAFVALTWMSGALRFDRERLVRGAFALRRFSAARVGRMQA